MRNHAWFVEVPPFDVPLSLFRKLIRVVVPWLLLIDEGFEEASHRGPSVIAGISSKGMAATLFSSSSRWEKLNRWEARTRMLAIYKAKAPSPEPLLLSLFPQDYPSINHSFCN